MSAELTGDAPVQSSDRPSRLNRWGTGVGLGVLGVLVALVFWPSHGLDTLDEPEQSLERVVTRDMDFRAAVRQLPPLERTFYYGLLVSSDADARADAIVWYEELIREEDSPLAELYRIVLLAEDGRLEAVRSAIAAWTPTDDWGRRLATLARAAYEPAPPPPQPTARPSSPLPVADNMRAVLDAARRDLPPGWFADRLTARLALRLGHVAAAEEAERATLTRGVRLLWRFRAIVAAEAFIILLGLVALAAWLLPRAMRAMPVAMAPIPPPWSLRDGVGLFTRGAVGLLGVAVVWPLLPDRAWSVVFVSALSAMPLGGYLMWFSGWSWRAFADAFGLRVPRGAWPTLVRATIALVGASTLSDVLIDLGGTRLGIGTHWADGFQERLVWGTRGDVLAETLDSCVFAPVLEELLFRGVLYGTLRLRLGPLPANLASAAVFALAHGYGVVGFVSVLASGMLWAFAYERTRSLLPGMLAHAASNVQATAIVLATLR